MLKNPWNDESRVEIVKARWADGYSASQIAGELSAALEPGEYISRNAVIGKIHRLGLTGPNTQAPNSTTKFRSTLPRQSRHDGKAATPRPFVPRIVETPAPEAIGPWDDFPAHGCCKYMNQHPAIQSWRCCGHPVKTQPNKVFSFCEFHHAISHQPPTNRRSEAALEFEGERAPEDEKANQKAVSFGGRRAIIDKIFAKKDAA